MPQIRALLPPPPSHLCCHFYLLLRCQLPPRLSIQRLCCRFRLLQLPPPPTTLTPTYAASSTGSPVLANVFDCHDFVRHRCCCHRQRVAAVATAPPILLPRQPILLSLLSSLLPLPPPLLPFLILLHLMTSPTNSAVPLRFHHRGCHISRFPLPNFPLNTTPCSIHRVRLRSQRTSSRYKKNTSRVLSCGSAAALRSKYCTSEETKQLHD